MTQLSSKVCILGDFAVGKTSTVERFVNNQFSDRYLTTIGVKVDTRQIALPGGVEVKLVLWDVAGTDRFGDIEFAYLRGAAGLLLVADGTRPETLATALALKTQADERYGALPSVFLLNKSDLVSDWGIGAEQERLLHDEYNGVFVTSAKIGTNVAEAMQRLAELIIDAEYSPAQ